MGSYVAPEIPILGYKATSWQFKYKHNYCVHQQLHNVPASRLSAFGGCSLCISQLRQYVTNFIVDISRSRQNGRDSARHILKRIFLNENYCILIQISLKFVLKGQIENNPSIGWDGWTPNRPKAIACNGSLIYWRICASFDLDELMALRLSVGFIPTL